MTSIDQAIQTIPDRSSLSEKLAKRQLFSILKKLPRGQLIIDQAGETFVFGDGDADQNLRAQIIIKNAAAYKDILLGGSIGAAEAYIQNYWESPDLVGLVRLMSINIDFLNGMDDNRKIFQKLADKLYHALNRNTAKKSRENISAHYDLSNDFFALFLDPKMMYSSAYFKGGNDSLEQASNHKLKLVCDKLDLTPGEHLLEIGTGWGGLAIYAAKNYGCKVTTTTISKRQYQYACDQVAKQNLGDRITVLLQDYRELEGSFDKLVSIEMIEAVGHQYYARYFEQCSKLLKPKGLMLIQAITIPDDRYNYARGSVDFIQRYIFPGGCLPSQQVISACIRNYTDMQIVHLEEIGEHYAKTLAHWRKRFSQRIDEVRRQNFDDSLIRLWNYYLCYCEGAFRERAIGTAQYLFAKPEWRDRLSATVVSVD